MKRIITYGTFDLLHVGHISLLKRARALGDFLIVAVSTDEFNALKHKDSFLPYQDRKSVLETLRMVDRVIPEYSWDQKKTDIKKYKIDTLVMGSDWKGKFDDLRSLCTVIYLPRTPRISSTSLKQRMKTAHRNDIHR